MPPKGKYTDPKLRDEIKEELKESDKGGAPGQWSARKAQMMASEYKKRGGDYTTDKEEKDESQQNLTQWGAEEWQTKEGSGNAKKEDGTEKRYLPKKAWENMSEKEKEETDQKKQEESKQGKQFVENTDKAKESRKKATKQQSEGTRQSARQKDQNAQKNQAAQKKDESAQKKSQGSQKKGKASDKKDTEKPDEEFEDPGIDDDVSPEHEDAKQDDDDGGDDDDDDEKNEPEADRSGTDQQKKAGQKRKADGKQSNGTSEKKQKDNSGEAKSNGTIGSKHMDATEPGKQGSNDRLPKEGQQVHWKAMPGYVDGEVVEILKKGKTVDGKSVKASPSDVKIVLKSNKSGKICVHKPSACYYD